jgi:oligoendopeptidase F
MELKWSLKELYESFESENFKNDLKACDTYIEDFNKWVDNTTKDYTNVLVKLEKYINNISYRQNLFSKLFEFSQLTLSVETNNKNALNSVEILEEKASRIAEGDAKIKNWISKISDLNSIIENSELLKKHAFFLNEIRESSKHYLSDKEEAVIAKMKNTGSSAWTKLRDLLTSTLRVDIELDGKVDQLPLTVVRNLAYEKEEVLRKKAYEAELKAYEKIEDSVAACLNGIKGEVITIAKMRGYKSP